MRGGIGEEAVELLAGPHHDGTGHCSAETPLGDAFGFPDHGERPTVRRLDQGGRVRPCDKFLGEGVVEGLAERAADSLQGAWTGYPPTRRADADPGVRARFRGDQLGVGGGLILSPGRWPMCGMIWTRMCDS
jgi:hypothetical protein